ncbi:TetR/AcrR family transcriptional regulator [Paenibacillus thiaminolyticus]|uniref:TetR/AcrR family transcriptional regulator n=1 Tax=Paenibacillus thiaminolyticus TaxID=49283 RepID=UPI002542A170|nr:TetR family transcriptional regulator [Paenibacillus thiaminolyticus]WII37569.1 TetR family transcriptional regulator [Paenibacillus thiaminolyticus]
MPKQTFFNLSEDKRRKLVSAMKEEFSRVPLHEASVASIVQTAGIPRGSFYQYFEDKDEAFYFLLEQHTKDNQEKFIASLQKFEGDIFDTFIEMFREMLELQNKENRNFFRNAFLNMNYKMETTFTQRFNEINAGEHFLEIRQLINTDKLNITNEQDLFHMMKIMMAITIQNLIHNFAEELPFEKAMDIYTLEMNLLKRGFYKGDNQ